jgi:hypothetical protein
MFYYSAYKYLLYPTPKEEILFLDNDFSIISTQRHTTYMNACKGNKLTRWKQYHTKEWKGKL